MKEIILRSKATPSLYIQLLDGEFALLGDEEAMITDNSTYAFQLYKLLKRAFDMGALLADEPFDSEEKTELLI